MKDQLKIAFILLAGVFLSAVPLLPANPTTSAMLAAVAKKKAAGVTLLLEEDYETPGEELTWTEVDTIPILDDASNTAAAKGTYSLFIDGSANTAEPDWSRYTDYGSDMGDHYGRFWIYIDSSTPNNDEWLFVGNSSTSSAGSSVAFRMTFGYVSSAPFARAYCYNGTAPADVALSANTWYRIEYFFSSTAGTLDWKIDGVDQTQAVGNAGRSARYFWLFGSELAEGYVDGHAWSAEGWIGDQ